MAFPAYSSELGNRLNEGSSVEKSNDWLQCSSYIAPEKAESTHTSKKKHKSRRERCSVKEAKQPPKSELFIVDTQPVPQIKCQSRMLSSSSTESPKTIEKKRKKKKKRPSKEIRYFSEAPNESVRDKIDQDEYFKRTREFNVVLRDHPDDVDTWRKYVEFQDQGEGTKRGITAKKLSIVEKALEHNPSSEYLLVNKLALMEELYPYEKVVSEAKIFATKHSTAKVGWQWLISSTQFNLTRLTAPGLINTFASMLQDTSKRGGQPKFILEVLLEVGLFLRHAGLWELLWTLIEQHLEICFSTVGSGVFKIPVSIPEDEIDKVEDEIMTSGLPSHALWIRTEHLRSCVHFFPADTETGDHQRLILPEDVTPLVYPITLQFSSRLSAIALTLLKVPPLPCSEAFMTYLGLNSVPWHLESSEILLSPLGTPNVTSTDFSYLDELKELLVPPQYIKDKLGCDVFLNAVDQIFDLIVQNCSQDKIVFTVWKIRWWQFCIKVKSMDSTTAKQFLTKAKTILKKERTSLPIYVEYAILEESAGNIEASLRVLETAINIQEPGLLANIRDKRYIFALYRTYAEVLLRNQPPNYMEKFHRLMIAMSFGQNMNMVTVTADLTRRALERFEHVSIEILSDLDYDYAVSLEDIVIGSSDLHWLVCHSWLNYLERGQLTDFLIDDVINKGPSLSESLTMLKIDIMGQMKKANSSSLNYRDYVDFIVASISRFPNNTSILHNLSSITCDGVKWSKISSSLIQTGSPIAALFLTLFSKMRFFSDATNRPGAVTKMFSLLNKCAESKQLERCPLIWRLLLQYISLTLDGERGEKEYHKAIEKCPWVKILYYEAAYQFPKFLADIQDLITEKELRLHVTPEELEILREPAPSEAQLESNVLLSTDPIDEKLEDKEQAAIELFNEHHKAVDSCSKVSKDSESDSSESSSPDDISAGIVHTDALSDMKSELVNDESCPTAENTETIVSTSAEADNVASVDNEDPTESTTIIEEDELDCKDLKKCRDQWENKRKIKRNWKEMQNPGSEYELSPQSSREGNMKIQPTNQMTLLEDLQMANISEDKCDDEETQPYVESKWNKDKLNSLRELWKNKRKK